MRKALFLVLGLLAQDALASYSMREINPDLFLPGIQRDFKKVDLPDEAVKKAAVKYLFDQEFIAHVATKAYSPTANFDDYYSKYAANYHLLDLDKDGISELIFNGFIDEQADMESIEIFQAVKNEWLNIFADKGNLAGYKIQPNTGEILLYQHVYPCCNNGSHNLNRLRLVGNKFQQIKRYFIGRDDNMKGQFFPKSSQFDGKFHILRDTITLFWSPEIISQQAWRGRTEENKIARFPAGTVYSVLSKKGKWKYVLMHGAPLLDPNRVINPSNFNDIWIYGWIN